MSRVKSRNTDHAYIRAAERCGLSKRRAEELMKQAQRHGIAPGNLPPSDLRDYLYDKQLSTNRRIKLYENYIFVFASTSTKCITMYPLDMSVVEKWAEKMKKVLTSPDKSTNIMIDQ